MALHWNISNIKNYKERCYRINTETEEKELRNITHTLIFIGGSIGLGEITEKNCAEYITRVRIYQGLFGDYGITSQHILDHIGLNTNWGDEPKTKWMNRIYKRALQENEKLIKNVLTKEELKETA